MNWSGKMWATLDDNGQLRSAPWRNEVETFRTRWEARYAKMNTYRNRGKVVRVQVDVKVIE